MPIPISFTASGNVTPSRFVTLSGARTVAQSVAGEIAIGVAGRGTKEAPIPGASALAAAAGDSCPVHGLGEVCLIEAGAAVTVGAYLKPDASGRGIAVATTNQYSAQALKAAVAAGDLIECYITRGVAP